MDVNAEELKQESKIRLCQKTSKKKLSMFWNKILWTDETNINLHQIDGKRKVAKERNSS